MLGSERNRLDLTRSPGSRPIRLTFFYGPSPLRRTRMQSWITYSLVYWSSLLVLFVRSIRCLQSVEFRSETSKPCSLSKAFVVRRFEGVSSFFHFDTRFSACLVLYIGD